MARKKKKSAGLEKQIILIVMLIGSIMFSALSIILAIGMIPTFVAAVTDRSERRMRALTVGALNFAGCMPFLIEVFRKGNNMETAVQYILEPRTIVVMYMAAGMGYLIDWAMTGIVSSIMVQRGKIRLRDIRKAQSVLVDRWGQEVTGKIPLDEYGFAREVAPPKTDGEAQPNAS